MSTTLGGITLGGPIGGWKFVNKPASSLPQDVASAIGIVQEQLIGATYTPLYYIAKQLVNGTNHLLICEQTLVIAKPEKHIVVMNINIPAGSVGGKGATVVDIITANEPMVSDELLALFNVATSKLLGASHKPVFYIGSQTVKGVNYFIVTESKTIGLNAKPYATIAKINLFDGNATIDFETI